MFGTPAKRSKIRQQANITIDSKPSSNTDSYKYFAIHIDMSFTLNDHIQKICKKVSSNLGLLRRIRPIHTTHADVCSHGSASYELLQHRVLNIVRDE